MVQTKTKRKHGKHRTRKIIYGGNGYREKLAEIKTALRKKLKTPGNNYRNSPHAIDMLLDGVSTDKTDEVVNWYKAEYMNKSDEEKKAVDEFMKECDLNTRFEAFKIDFKTATRPTLPLPQRDASQKSDLQLRQETFDIGMNTINDGNYSEYLSFFKLINKTEQNQGIIHLYEYITRTEDYERLLSILKWIKSTSMSKINVSWDVEKIKEFESKIIEQLRSIFFKVDMYGKGSMWNYIKDNRYPNDSIKNDIINDLIKEINKHIVNPGYSQAKSVTESIPELKTMKGTKQYDDLLNQTNFPTLFPMEEIDARTIIHEVTQTSTSEYYEKNVKNVIDAYLLLLELNVTEDDDDRKKAKDWLLSTVDNQVKYFIKSNNIGKARIWYKYAKNTIDFSDDDLNDINEYILKKAEEKKAREKKALSEKQVVKSKSEELKEKRNKASANAAQETASKKLDDEKKIGASRYLQTKARADEALKNAAAGMQKTLVVNQPIQTQSGVDEAEKLLADTKQLKDELKDKLKVMETQRENEEEEKPDEVLNQPRAYISNLEDEQHKLDEELKDIANKAQEKTLALELRLNVSDNLKKMVKLVEKKQISDKKIAQENKAALELSGAIKQQLEGMVTAVEEKQKEDAKLASENSAALELSEAIQVDLGGMVDSVEKETRRLETESEAPEIGPERPIKNQSISYGWPIEFQDLPKMPLEKLDPEAAVVQLTINKEENGNDYNPKVVLMEAIREQQLPSNIVYLPTGIFDDPITSNSAYKQLREYKQIYEMSKKCLETKFKKH